MDLHGCSVRDALHITRRSIQEAYRRGRARVDVVHGSSTTSSYAASGTRTIKGELLDRLESGHFDAWANGFVTDASGGRTTVWLKIGGNSDPSKIQVRDVVPP